MPRKIVQIAATTSAIYALCEDGSMWMLIGGHLDWLRIVPIPQDEKGEE